jgi:hypothetical protein
VREATKIVEIDKQRYHVRLFTPAVGGYIWQKLMAACFRARRVMPDSEPVQPSDAGAELTPEEKLRGLCGLAFMYLEIDEYTFVQNSCMKVLSQYDANDAPMPVMDNTGTWFNKELPARPLLVTKLMVEVLVHNLVGFLE